MSRSTKKGPAIEPKLLKKVEAMNRASTENGYKNMVAVFYYNASDGRVDNSGT